MTEKEEEDLHFDALMEQHQAFIDCTDAALEGKKAGGTVPVEVILDLMKIHAALMVAVAGLVDEGSEEEPRTSH